MNVGGGAHDAPGMICMGSCFGAGGDVEGAVPYEMIDT